MTSTKRIMDVVFSATALVACLPVLAAVAGLVWLSMGRPLLFRQVRAGYRGRPFVLLKFRTMTDARSPDGSPLPDAQRLNAAGRLIRSLSLDELPQLWNVLRGQMSLVGPRPLLMEYLPYYTRREQQRHLVRPGITGLAQISGRNQLSWDQRLELDVQYVARLSIRLDLWILIMTVWRVVQRRDVIVVPGTVQGPLSLCRKDRVCLDG